VIEMENEIEVNGKKYVAADTIQGQRESIVNKKYVMVRTYTAGVFVGHLKSRKGKEVVLQDARRIWYWKGAASLSQLAQTGTTRPSECKFPCPVDEVILTEAIEILTVTAKAKKSIESVPVWKLK